MNIYDTRLIQNFLNFKHEAIFNPQHFFTPKHPETMSAFEKVRWMVQNQPHSLQWKQEKFAAACGLPQSAISRIFRNVILPEHTTSKPCYPGRLFRHYDRIIFMHKGKNNYISAIIAKRTSLLKHTLLLSIQSKFNSAGRPADPFDELKSNELIRRHPPLNIGWTNNPRSCFLAMLRDEETFSLSEREVVDQIVNHTGANFSVTSFTKLLAHTFRQEGVLWPALKIRQWDERREEALKLQDPYFEEKFFYYKEMKRETIETIRRRFLGTSL